MVCFLLESGVYWTKFECTLNKTLTRNEMRLGHARGLACAKTKKFPCIFLASPPPTPPPRSGKRNGKEFFGFASPFQSPKRAILFCHFCLLFSPPSRRPRRFLSAFCGSSKLCASDRVRW